MSSHYFACPRMRASPDLVNILVTREMQHDSLALVRAAHVA
jgi:hypothetical protein